METDSAAIVCFHDSPVSNQIPEGPEDFNLISLFLSFSVPPLLAFSVHQLLAFSVPQLLAFSVPLASSLKSPSLSASSSQQHLGRTLAY
jgi:hypothetical protein